jgi:hypothetical protein
MANWLRALAPVVLTAIALVVFLTGDRTVGMLALAPHHRVSVEWSVAQMDDFMAGVFA